MVVRLLEFRKVLSALIVGIGADIVPYLLRRDIDPVQPDIPGESLEGMRREQHVLVVLLLGGGGEFQHHSPGRFEKLFQILHEHILAVHEVFYHFGFLDQSKLFKGTVEPASRSLMNVPFVTGDKDMDAKFVKEAKAAGLVNLKGHRTVGGMRASIYNAMPKEGVEALVAFMKKFEEENV